MEVKKLPAHRRHNTEDARSFRQRSHQTRSASQTITDPRVRSAEYGEASYTTTESQIIWKAVLQSAEMKLEPAQIEFLAIELGRPYSSIQSKEENLRATSNDPILESSERQIVVDAVLSKGNNFAMCELASKLAVTLLRVPILVEQLITEVSNASNIQVIPHRPRGLEEWSRIVDHDQEEDTGSADYSHTNEDLRDSSVRSFGWGKEELIIPSIEREKTEVFIKFESEDERSFQSSTDYSIHHRPRSRNGLNRMKMENHVPVSYSRPFLDTTSNHAISNRPFTSPLSLKRKRSASNAKSLHQVTNRQQVNEFNLKTCNYCDVLSLYELEHETTCPIREEDLLTANGSNTSPITTFQLTRTEWMCLYRLNEKSLCLCRNALAAKTLVNPFSWSNLEAILSIPQSQPENPSVSHLPHEHGVDIDVGSAVHNNMENIGSPGHAPTTSLATTLEPVEFKRRRKTQKIEGWLPNVFRR